MVLHTPISRRKRRFVNYLPLLGLVILGSIFRFYNLGKQPLWVDEINTWMFAKMTLGYLWGETAANETNPPLFYTIEKLCLFFGQSEFILRFPAAIFGILTILASYLLGKTLVNHQVGIITAALVATSKIHIKYSQEARTYTMLVMVSILVLWSFVYILLYYEKKANFGKKQSRKAFKDSLNKSSSKLKSQISNQKTKLVRVAWATYILGALITMYSHNTAFLLLLSANSIFISWLIVRQFYKHSVFFYWIVANIMILFGSLWWVLTMSRQDVPSWIHPPTIPSLGKLISALYFQRGLQGIIYQYTRLLILGIFLFAVFTWFRKRQLTQVTISVLFSIGTVFMGYLISFWKPILIPRVFLWTTIPFYIVLAFGITSLKPKFLTNIVLTIILLFQIVSVTNYYQNNHKEQWNKVVPYVTKRLEKEDIILIYKANLEAFLYYVNPSITDRATDPNIKQYLGDKIAVPIYRLYEEDYQHYDRIVKNFVRENRRIWLIMRARTAKQPNLEKSPGEILLQEFQEHLNVIQYQDIKPLEIFLLKDLSLQESIHLP